MDGDVGFTSFTANLYSLTDASADVLQRRAELAPLLCSMEPAQKTAEQA
jgi:hypothetical protein